MGWLHSDPAEDNETWIRQAAQSLFLEERFFKTLAAFLGRMLGGA